MRELIRTIFAGGCAVDAAGDLPLIEDAFATQWPTGSIEPRAIAGCLEALHARSALVDALLLQRVRVDKGLARP